MILPKERDPRFVTIRRGGTLTDSDHQLLALWAASCAEHVLDLFESAQPEDPRPRRAIELGRAWVRREITMTEARSAGGHAMAAARNLHGAPRHAAYAAGQAAVVAHVAAHELGAAAYAIKAARAAKVSVETIYKGFSGKPGLVRAIWDKGLAGLGPVPAWQRSDEMASEEEDPRNVIRNWGVLTTEVAPRAAPILLLVRAAAATDPEMAALLKETDQERLVRMEQNARRLFGRAGLRDGLTIEEARDIMWAYSSPELYETLVLRRGWPLDRYGRFVAEGMIAALLP